MTTYTIHNDNVLGNCMRHLQKLPAGKLWDVTIVEHRAKRSLAQNSLYWKWLTEISKQHPTSDGEFLDKEEWHYLCALKFLGLKELVVCGKTYKLPVKSTKKLKIAEFAEYLTKIEVEFLSKGVSLTFPDEYGLAMGKS